MSTLTVAVALTVPAVIAGIRDGDPGGVERFVCLAFRSVVVGDLRGIVGELHGHVVGQRTVQRHVEADRDGRQRAAS